MYDLIHAVAWLANKQGWSSHPAQRFLPFTPFSIKKNTEIVSGLVSEEHPFHQVQTQPGKAKKHRYERKKVRNILKVADWGEAEEY